LAAKRADLTCCSVDTMSARAAINELQAWVSPWTTDRLGDSTVILSTLFRSTAARQLERLVSPPENDGTVTSGGCGYTPSICVGMEWLELRRSGSRLAWSRNGRKALSACAGDPGASRFFGALAASNLCVIPLCNIQRVIDCAWYEGIKRRRRSQLGRRLAHQGRIVRSAHRKLGLRRLSLARTEAARGASDWATSVRVISPTSNLARNSSSCSADSHILF